MQIIREADGLLTVTDDKKLYSLVSSGIAIIAPQRVKSAHVTFWTEEDWTKEVEKAKKQMVKSKAKLENNPVEEQKGATE